MSNVLKLIGIVVGSILALGLISILSVVVINEWISRPKIMTELDGFKLGETKSDVEFKNGDISSFRDVNSEFYTIERTKLHFNEDSKLDLISHSCNLEETDFTSANDIDCQHSGDMITEKFSKVKIYCMTKNNPFYENVKEERVYSDEKHNTIYYLVRNSVTRIDIVSKDNFMINDKMWKLCN